MEKDIYLIYDDTFNGFLTAVYAAFEGDLKIAGIQGHKLQQKGLFADNRNIITNLELAKKVWYGVSNLNSVAMKTIYFAFLSESEDIPFLLFKYIKKIVAKNTFIHTDLPEGSIQRIYHLAELVSKKKNKIEAAQKFNLSKDGVLYGVLSPEYHMLPLVSKHFRSVYKDRCWLLYDSQRNYGLYYNLKNVQLISFDRRELYDMMGCSSLKTPPMGNKDQTIWNSFFTKASIQKLVSDRTQTHDLHSKKRVYERNREAV